MQNKSFIKQNSECVRNDDDDEERRGRGGGKLLSLSSEDEQWSFQAVSHCSLCRHAGGTCWSVVIEAIAQKTSIHTHIKRHTVFLLFTQRKKYIVCMSERARYVEMNLKVVHASATSSPPVLHQMVVTVKQWLPVSHGRNITPLEQAHFFPRETAVGTGWLQKAPLSWCYKSSVRYKVEVETELLYSTVQKKREREISTSERKHHHQVVRERKQHATSAEHSLARTSSRIHPSLKRKCASLCVTASEQSEQVGDCARLCWKCCTAEEHAKKQAPLFLLLLCSLIDSLRLTDGDGNR